MNEDRRKSSQSELSTFAPGCLIVPELMGSLTRALFIAPYFLLTYHQKKRNNNTPKNFRREMIIDTAIGLGEIGLMCIGSLAYFSGIIK